MKIRREGPVPPEMGRRLTKGNRQSLAGGRPETVAGESGHVPSDDRARSLTSPEAGNDDARQLLASLRELVDREGPVKAAAALGVTYRTVMRAIDTNTLTRRMEDALKRRHLESGGAVAEPVMRRLEALERRQEELEAGLLMLAEEVGARLAEVSGDLGELRDAPARDPSTPAVKGEPRAVIGRPQRVDRLPLGHPEVVTLEPVPDEEFDYAEAAPLVVEWRQARAVLLSRGASRVERARGWVRMCELELVLIGDHELTLPPSTYRWDESRRRDELYWGKASLAHARWELVQALFWRWVRRVLTVGLWRR